MSICYAIKDWEKHFENSESRKIKSLTWVPMKNKHDGKGYRRVVSHPKSIQVFCAWCLLVQVASKTPVRGLLRDDDGPLQPSDLSDKTGFPASIFEEAYKALSDPRIAWLVVVNPDGIPASPETSGSVGIEQKGREGKGIQASPPPISPSSKGVQGEGTEGGGQKSEAGGQTSDLRPQTSGSVSPHREDEHIAAGAAEVPTIEEAVAMTMAAGIDEGFVRYVFGTWAMRAGRDGAGVLVPWLPYVTNRWANESVQWRNGTHRGKNNSKTGGKPNPRNVGMSETAADKTRDVLAVVAAQKGRH